MVLKLSTVFHTVPLLHAGHGPNAKDTIKNKKRSHLHGVYIPVRSGRRQKRKHTNRYQMVSEENKSIYFREALGRWTLPNKEGTSLVKGPQVGVDLPPSQISKATLSMNKGWKK